MSIGIWLDLNWHLIGSQLASDWMSICIWLDVNWYLIGCQLASDWMSIGIWLDVNWHLIGCQLAPYWMSISIRLPVNWHSNGSPLVFHWHSSDTRVSVNWHICVGLVDSRFGQHQEYGRNRGFSLVESSEYWLLIGREVPEKISKGVPFKSWICANREFLTLNDTRLIHLWMS